MNRRELLGSLAGAAGAVAGLATVAAVTPDVLPAVRVYETVTPICGGCGQQLMWLDPIGPPTDAPQRAICGAPWCSQGQVEVRVPRLRRLA